MANSVSDMVGEAAQAAVQEIGIQATIPGSNGQPAKTITVPVSRRKTPSAPQGTPVPVFVVSVGDVPATTYLTELEKLRTYPIAVTIVTPGGMAVGDDPIIRQWRDQIDAAVDNRAAFRSVPGFNQVDAQGGPPFDPAALPKDFNYSIQTFAVQVIEPRTG